MATEFGGQESPSARIGRGWAEAPTWHFWLLLRSSLVSPNPGSASCPADTHEQVHGKACQPSHAPCTGGCGPGPPLGVHFAPIDSDGLCFALLHIQLFSPRSRATSHPPPDTQHLPVPSLSSTATVQFLLLIHHSKALSETGQPIRSKQVYQSFHEASLKSMQGQNPL